MNSGLPIDTLSAQIKAQVAKGDVRLTQKEAAAVMNISVRAVKRATKLVREAETNPEAAELVEQVERGELTINAALRQLKPSGDGDRLELRAARNALKRAARIIEKADDLITLTAFAELDQLLAEGARLRSQYD